MGAWACPSCIISAGLHRGDLHAYSSAKSNYCGVGGHQVADVVRWAPSVRGAGTRPSSPPAAVTRALRPGDQGSLF